MYLIKTGAVLSIDFMRELYIPNKNHTIGYSGNKIYKPMKQISNAIEKAELYKRIEEFRTTKKWEHIARINQTIALSVNEYFNKLGSAFTLLPLTTRMISSPAALYGKGHIDYTSDTVPVKLKWFNLKKDIFLSESSQIYLELHLINENLNSVYSIYNSFRKEKSDATHLSEFHHIEFEGKISQKENIRVMTKLIFNTIKKLLNNNIEDLSYFLYDEDIEDLKKLSNSTKIKEITFDQALDVLYTSTKNPKYKKFTTKYFGSWEEVKLTKELDNMVIISEFPLYEVAFYHAPIIDNKNREVADNSDFIWPYYREFAGSGHRVRNMSELLIKAKKFNLPREDYKYYIQSRSSLTYKETSGFGIGWERMLQGLLKMPYIHSVATFPRVHNTLYP